MPLPPWKVFGLNHLDNKKRLLFLDRKWSALTSFQWNGLLPYFWDVQVSSTQVPHLHQTFIMVSLICLLGKHREQDFFTQTSPSPDPLSRSFSLSPGCNFQMRMKCKNVSVFKCSNQDHLEHTCSQQGFSSSSSFFFSCLCCHLKRGRQGWRHW